MKNMKFMLVVLLAVVLGISLIAGCAPQYNQILSTDTPQQVYEKFNNEMKNITNINQMIKYATEAEIKKFNDAMAKTKLNQKSIDNMLTLIKKSRPVEYKVLKVNITGDKAELEISGVANNPFTGKSEKFVSKVSMLKEKGIWKIKQEEAKSVPEKNNRPKKL